MYMSQIFLGPNETYSIMNPPEGQYAIYRETLLANDIVVKAIPYKICKEEPSRKIFIDS